MQEIEKKYVEKKIQEREDRSVIRLVTVDQAAAIIYEPTLQYIIKKNH